MSLGVCYYPEQWPRDQWAGDAERMADIGISRVRIAEFAWALIEPEPGCYDWAWLDQAIDTLARAGLPVILGTPTATPPKWLIDAHPDILAHDGDGRPRRFGSRRHYCFSSPVYRRETSRIVTAMAERYGRHDAVTAWQTDNEYGCHDTVRSYSPAAEAAFRLWLQARYQTIEALNAAWGNVFWSQIYRDFGEVDLPHLTVTETNPSHRLDFYRFSSDQVIAYNQLQVEILRRHSPGRDIIHNFMGHMTDFDHFALGTDLDIAAWDSYPLGFLDGDFYTPDEQQRYRRQGHPDFAGFHHDLYRACGRGRFAVMEQQPGPVNWAAHNAAPLRGMVRLWLHEAAAHGAELTSIFRWRQAPFAQEQMHAGLLRADASITPALDECRQVGRERPVLGANEPAKAPVALLFSYDAQWMFEAQPQGAAWDYRRLCFDWYGALRRKGLDVDILPPGAALNGYRLVLVPSLPYLDPATAAALTRTDAQVLIGPRTGSKTGHLTIPAGMTDAAFQALIPLKVIHSESFPPEHRERVTWDGRSFDYGIWLDHVETSLTPLAATVGNVQDNAARPGESRDPGPTKTRETEQASGFRRNERGVSSQARPGTGILFRQDRIWALTSLLGRDGFDHLIDTLGKAAGLNTHHLPEGLRLRQYGNGVFAANYSADQQVIPPSLMAGVTTGGDHFSLGPPTLAPGAVAYWRRA